MSKILSLFRRRPAPAPAVAIPVELHVFRPSGRRAVAIVIRPRAR